MIEFICVLASIRIFFGLAPIVAAGLGTRLLGVDPSQDHPTTRVFARLFGIRDVGLGVLVLWMLDDLELLRFALLFNAAHDVADVGVLSIPLIKRQGIDRPAALCLAAALTGATCWLVSWAILGG